MRRRSVYLVLLAAALAACGGGSSPTAPPPSEQVLVVRGTWQGFWALGGSVTLELEQAAGSREVTGTLTLFGLFPMGVEGTTTQTGPGRGTFEWASTGIGCGSASGKLNVEGSRMSGPAELITCGDTQGTEGPLFLERADP